MSSSDAPRGSWKEMPPVSGVEFRDDVLEKLIIDERGDESREDEVGEGELARSWCSAGRV